MPTAAPGEAWLCGQQPTQANALRLAQRLLRRSCLQPRDADACLAEALQIEALARANMLPCGQPQMGDKDHDPKRTQDRVSRNADEPSQQALQDHGQQHAASQGLLDRPALHAGRPGKSRGGIANSTTCGGEWALLYFALTGLRPGPATSRHLKVPHPSLPHRWIWLGPQGGLTWGLCLRHAIKMAPAARAALLARAREAQKAVPSALRAAPKQTLSLATLKGLFP